MNYLLNDNIKCPKMLLLILEGKYRLSIGRLSFPHTCDRAQQKLKSDILVYSNMLFTQTFSNWKLIWTTCTHEN
jgi:hypothetical protein